MNCLKCGKALTADGAFCPDCLQSMEAHPIPPGTPIVFYPREVQPEKPRKTKRFSYADAFRAQRKAIKWLSIGLAVSLLVIGILGVILWHTLETIKAAETPKPVIGQNYTTETD